ncbi:hypothetical protein KR215_005792, partial [Drosophila sulfurigaster]
RMIFNNYCCNFNPDIISNFTLQIPNGLIYVNCWLKKALTFGLKAHLGFDYRPSKAKLFESVLHHDFDYCSLFKATRMTLVRRLYLSMRKKANFSPSCPMVPSYYYMHGWKADGNMVPSFLPNGEYRVTAAFYYGTSREDNEQSVLNCSVEGNLV